MNVLIVDDSNIVRRVLKNSLTKYFDGDVTFFEAENGVQAVEVMKKETINIMTLDWNMPIMNGEQVVDAVRANSEWNKTRIIMATTEGTKAQVMKMLNIIKDNTKIFTKIFNFQYIS